MAENNLLNFTKIIVPLNGSKMAERALGYAITLADAYKSEIVVVSVVPPGKRSGSPFEIRLAEICPELADTLKNMPTSLLMETYHDVTLSALRKRGIKVKSILKEGDASVKSILSIILELINRERADLLVITASRKSGFQKLKEGSLSEEMFKLSPIPVLAVK